MRMQIKKRAAAAILAAGILVTMPTYAAAPKTVRAGNQTYAAKNGLRYENGYYHYYVDGKKLKNTWKKVGSSKYYFKKNGNAAVGSCKVGKTYYVFSAKARLFSASSKKIVKVKNTYYQIKKGGKAAQGWSSNKKYYFAKTGKQVKNGWTADKKYYLGADGLALKGSRVLKGKFYYFGSKGKYDQAETGKYRRAAVVNKEMTDLYALIGQPLSRKVYDSAGCYATEGKEGLLTYKNFTVSIYISEDGQHEYYLGADAR